MQDVLCFHLTRFTPNEIHRLLPLLHFQDIRFRNRFEATPEEAFAVVLIRLSYPTRYWSMMDRFGHSRTWLSVVFNDTIIHLYRRFRKMLEWDDKRLTFEKLSEYALAIHNFGGGHSFWGFIDGTLNATCRPIIDQQEFYSGHKRKHGYKYQSVVSPDGLVSSLMGPFIGRRGDWKMVALSAWKPNFAESTKEDDLQWHYISMETLLIVLFTVLWDLTKIIPIDQEHLNTIGSTRIWPSYV